MSSPPATVLVVRLAYADGRISGPTIVNDLRALRRAAPGDHDKRLNDAIDKVLAGDGDLIDLALDAQALFSDDPVQSLHAARTWSRYEGSCLHLLQHPEVADQFGTDAVALGVGRLEAHYFQHQAFMAQDQLIRNLGRIRHLPAAIIQGRYDVVCPVRSAWRLHQAWPEASFEIIEDAGHAAFEPGIASALVAATERFRRSRTL
jgi:proline iminopeptidase